MRIRNLFFIALCVLLTNCGQSRKDRANAMFELLPASATNITFRNAITDNDSVNILTYEYLYNGGGVAILDVDNDGLKDIFFTGNQVPSRLYLSKGNFVFEDITERSGIKTDGWNTGVSVVDVNGDGFDDIYVCMAGMGNRSQYPNKLFINQGDLTFRESAKEYGIDDPSESIQAAFFDYDRDGDLDMYLLNGGGFEKSALMVRPVLEHGENRNTDRLYRNDYDSLLRHPVFTNVSGDAGILVEGFGLGVAILDANDDHWPDVYVSNDYLSRDLLYVNNKNGTFSEQSRKYFAHTSHFSMGNDAGDINNDGLCDIVTVDMLPGDLQRRKRMFGPGDYDRFQMAAQYGYNYQYMRNMLQLNHGCDGFSEVGQLAGIHRTDWSWAPLIADLDNDGFQDLFITNGYGRDVTDLDFVKFRRDAASPFNSPVRIRKLLYDSLQKRPAVALANFAYRNEHALRFTDHSEKWGMEQPSISSGSAYADLDNDGDLDLVVSNLDREAFVYRNRLRETDSLHSNFVQVVLEGPTQNRKGIGAVVTLWVSDKRQTRYAQVVRGFQSSVDNVIHFGLGAALADSVTVAWPDGRMSLLNKVELNRRLSVRHHEAIPGTTRRVRTNEFFRSVQVAEFTHVDNPTTDFQSQPLLIHGFSNAGPGLAVADVNGDGLDDFFAGNGYGSDGAVFIQTVSGKFTRRTIPSSAFEDLGAAFFDADSDGNQDLYVVSGGTERYEGHEGYQDRLYLNDGRGNFTFTREALPKMHVSTSTVAAADFDRDGDMDLFVGGRVVPGKFPVAPRSFLLRNEGGKFEDVTAKMCPTLEYAGMVTSAVWTDIDSDLHADLIVVGEGMRITVLRGDGSRFTDITDDAGLRDSYGMWNSISSADLDGDGDMDLIGGNLGLNAPFHASPDEPVEMHYADFDNNGSIDPIYASYEEGESVPMASLDQLTRQIPSLKKSILHYRDFARTNTDELLAILDAPYKTVTIKELSSCVAENMGNGKFNLRPLPREAQISSVNGICVEDVDADGQPDLILAGNSADWDVVTGKFDASIGCVLLNDGAMRFRPVANRESGMVIEGAVRGMAFIQLAKGERALLVSRNGGALKSFILSKAGTSTSVRAEANEIATVLSSVSGSRRRGELPRGGSYFSQARNVLAVPVKATRISFVDMHGDTTRTISIPDQHRQRIAASVNPR